MKQEIPHYNVGKRLYFRKEDLDGWINKAKANTRQEIIDEANEFIIRKGRRHTFCSLNHFLRRGSISPKQGSTSPKYPHYHSR